MSFLDAYAGTCCICGDKEKYLWLKTISERGQSRSIDLCRKCHHYIDHAKVKCPKCSDIVNYTIQDFCRDCFVRKMKTKQKLEAEENEFLKKQSESQRKK